MKNKDLCERCEQYSTDYKCDLEDSCDLLNILKESRRLKKELNEVKKERDRLKSEIGWISYPESMGR